MGVLNYLKQFLLKFEVHRVEEVGRAVCLNRNQGQGEAWSSGQSAWLLKGGPGFESPAQHPQNGVIQGGWTAHRRPHQNSWKNSPPEKQLN